MTESDIALKLYPLHQVFSRLYLVLSASSEPGFAETPLVVCEHFLLFPHKKYASHALIFIKDVPTESAKRIFARFGLHRAAQQPDASLMTRCAASLVDFLHGIAFDKRIVS
jgi:hypothetical protein